MQIGANPCRDVRGGQAASSLPRAGARAPGGVRDAGGAGGGGGDAGLFAGIENDWTVGILPVGESGRDSIRAESVAIIGRLAAAGVQLGAGAAAGAVPRIALLRGREGIQVGGTQFLAVDWHSTCVRRVALTKLY